MVNGTYPNAVKNVLPARGERLEQTTAARPDQFIQAVLG
jgi:hypothetical protein